MANWSIVAGANSIYGGTYTINSSAEDVKPTNAAYVSELFGNDTHGNGSRLRPFRTRQAALNSFTDGSTFFLICGTALYRDTINAGSRAVTVLADGYVIFDMINSSSYVANNNLNAVGVVFRNFSTLTNANFSYNRCVFENGTIFSSNASASKTCIFCVFYNVTTLDLDGSLGSFVNNTLINVRDVRFNTNTTSQFFLQNNIYKNCNIVSKGTTGLPFSLFHNCNFRFASTNGTAPANLPETSSNTYVPTGYVRITDPATLKSTHATYAGYTNPGMDYNVFADPLFVDAANNIYSLQFNTPAKNMSYNGDIIGAKGLGLKKDSSNSPFLTNITLDSGNYAITTADTPGTIEMPVGDLGKEYPINSIDFSGSIADRNGDWPDTLRDIDTTTIAAGTNVLTEKYHYVVEGANITWNSATILVGAKFTAVAGQLSFTGTGVVRRILEAPNRVVCEMRFSSVSVADVASQSWFLFEWNKQPRVNRSGNVANGAITNGSGDVNYVAATSFPVFFRYYQERITLRDNNLQ